MTVDVRGWVDPHRVELDRIAERTGLDVSLVHLAAVLRLDGLTDDQIQDQLLPLGSTRPLTHRNIVARALDQLGYLLPAVEPSHKARPGGNGHPPGCITTW